MNALAAIVGGGAGYFAGQSAYDNYRPPPCKVNPCTPSELIADARNRMITSIIGALVGAGLGVALLRYAS